MVYSSGSYSEVKILLKQRKEIKQRGRQVDFSKVGPKGGETVQR